MTKDQQHLRRILKRNERKHKWQQRTNATLTGQGLRRNKKGQLVSILNAPGRIGGVRPIKHKAEIELPFDKTKPLGPYNFPTLSYAEYRIWGYRTDAAGIKHPVSWTERLPVGKRINIEKHKNITITGCTRAVGGPRQKGVKSVYRAQEEKEH